MVNLLENDQEKNIANIQQEVDSVILNAWDVEKIMLSDSQITSVQEEETLTGQQRIDQKKLRISLITANVRINRSESVFTYFYKSKRLISESRAYDEDNIDSYLRKYNLNQDEFLKVLQNLTPDTVTILYGSDGSGYLLAAQPGYDDSYKEKLSCVAAIFSIDENFFPTSDGEIYITDKNGDFLYGSEIGKEALANSNGEDGTITLSEGTYSQTSLQSKYKRLNYYYLVKSNTYFEPAKMVWMQLFAELLLYIVVGFLLSIFASRRTYSPYKNIIQVLHRQKSGEDYDTIESLEQAIRSYAQEKETNENRLSLSHQQISNSTISGLLTGHSRNVEVLSQYIEDGEPYRVLTLFLENVEQSEYFANVSSDKLSETEEMLFFAVRNLLEEVLFDKRNGVSIEMDGFVAAIIQDESKDEKEYTQDIERAVSLIQKHLIQTVRCCVSLPHHHLDSAPIAFNEAMSLCQSSEKTNETILYAESNKEEAAKPADKIGNRPAEKKNNDWILEVKDYIAKEYTDPNLNVSMIAEKWNMSLNMISRKFRAEIGHSILDEIHMTRLSYAKEMLQNGKTVKETAEAAGYLDSRAMIQAFKRYEGITPGQLKNKEK